MIKINYKTKELVSLTDILLNVEHFVAPHINIKSKPSKCKIVEMFDNKKLYVAQPIKDLDCINILEIVPDCKHEDPHYLRGKLKLNCCTYRFSIQNQGTILYIGLEQ